MADNALTAVASPRMAVWKSLLLTLPIALLSTTGLMRLLQAGKDEPVALIAGLVTWALLTVFFYLMLRTGKTHRYRSVLFINLAIALPLHLISGLFE
ncbi:MAG: hypothetical protein NTU62_12760, partial [Spirochaetes bacterium]|nr:hypothetical protein [Spirochaetota bacterium]